MGARERVRDLLGDVQRIVDRETTFTGDALAQTFTIDEWHRVVQPAVGLARGERGNDVRVLRSSRELNLPLEPVGAHRAGDVG